MKIHTEEEKHHYEEVEKTHKIILNKEEYEYWKNIWLDALGWSHEFPHTTNLHKIILRGNFKWHPFTDVELEIELEGYEDKGKGKIRISRVKQV
jgi:hypothetical protein